MCSSSYVESTSKKGTKISRKIRANNNNINDYPDYIEMDCRTSFHNILLYDINYLVGIKGACNLKN